MNQALALPLTLVSAQVGPGCGSEMIRRLEASNLFLVPLDDEGIWFRYHHLFGETLRARSRCSTDGRGLEILHRAAAWRRMPIGFLLSAVFVVKAAAMGLAICAMLLSAWAVQGHLELAPFILFAVAALIAGTIGLQMYRSVNSSAGA